MKRRILCCIAAAGLAVDRALSLAVPDDNCQSHALQCSKGCLGCMGLAIAQWGSSLQMQLKAGVLIKGWQHQNQGGLWPEYKFAAAESREATCLSPAPLAACMLRFAYVFSNARSHAQILVEFAVWLQQDLSFAKHGEVIQSLMTSAAVMLGISPVLSQPESNCS